MNIDTIKKYKREFDYFINGGKLLWANAKDSKLSWYQAKESNPEFFNTNDEYHIYIMDDEYVEFRKALAEGKTIQLNEAEKFADSNKGWVDLSCISLGYSRNLFPVNYYRIKPEEQHIKIGDYLYDIQFNKYHRIENVLDEKVETKLFRIYKSSINDYDYRLWKPKVGELVVMYSEDYSTGFTVTLWEENSKFIPVPFTGELPE
jgi:hypothetical protein